MTDPYWLTSSHLYFLRCPTHMFIGLFSLMEEFMLRACKFDFITAILAIGSEANCTFFS